MSGHYYHCCTATAGTYHYYYFYYYHCYHSLRCILVSSVSEQHLMGPSSLSVASFRGGLNLHDRGSFFLRGYSTYMAGGHCSQGQIKCLQGPRELKNVVKCGCVLDDLLFMECRNTFVNHIYSFYHRYIIKIYKYVSK
jgi:hypothetical protein